MSPSTRLAGCWAEDRALGMLRGHGWHLVDRNWSCRWGELDLLMEKPRRLLLVEVKGRRSAFDGWGVAALGSAKRRRLARALACWQAAHPQHAGRGVELVFALVPLPPAQRPVRWIRIET